MAISGCTFTDNQAVGADGDNDFTQKYGGQAVGGAILSAAPLTITGSTFTDNLAQGGDQGNNLNPDDGGPFVAAAVEGGGICEPRQFAHGHQHDLRRQPGHRR